MKSKEIVEATLLYVGVPAITLYPLGFVALGLQMWRDPLFPYADFGPIWDAVSLVLRTVVIGTGVELLYLSVISTLFGVGIASATFHFLGRPKVGDKHEGRSRRARTCSSCSLSRRSWPTTATPSTGGRTPPTWPVSSSSPSGEASSSGTRGCGASRASTRPGWR